MTAAAPAITEFDYYSVDLETADHLRDLAKGIRARHKRQVADILQTGRDLIAVKASLEHGQFLTWLSAEFNWSERTARNYIAATEAFGERMETVADLPPTAIYALASPSTPPAIRVDVLGRLSAGERLSPATIRSMISSVPRARRAPPRQIDAQPVCPIPAPPADPSLPPDHIASQTTALSAILFSLEAIEDHEEREAFLRAWLNGDVSAWPEFGPTWVPSA